MVSGVIGDNSGTSIQEVMVLFLCPPKACLPMTVRQ